MSYSLNSIRYIGTHGTSDSLKKVIVTVNTISLITGLLAFCIGPFLSIYTGNLAILWGAYCEVLLFTTVIALNYLKKYGIATIATHIFQNASVLYFGLLFGAHVDVKLMIVFLGIIPLLIFKDKPVILTSLLITALTLFILEYNYQYHLFPSMTMSLEHERFTRWLSLVVILFLVVTVVWITEQDKKKANQALQKANAMLEHLTEKLQESVNAKAAYVREITHEIRGPFNAIFSIAQLLLNSTSKSSTLKEVKGDIETLNAGCYQTLSIINSALDVSKLETSIFPVEISSINLRSWIQEIVSIFSYIASHKQVTLHLKVGVIPSIVEGDSEKLTRIANNLIYNAIKFTRKGSTVTISIDSTNSKWTISIADQGPGMSQIELDDAFKIYRSSSKDSSTGAGLGLYFVKNTIDLLKGEISVFSLKGRGTNFTASFPLAIGKLEASNPSTEVPSDEINMGGKEILIIDDDVMQTTYISKYLQSIGASVRIAETAREGFKMLKEQTADLILLDNTLPDMSGLEVLEELGRNPFYVLIPTVLVTADNAVTREESLNAGAYDYLLKPIIFKDLKKLLSFNQIASYRQ
ncbi:ATP-binding response regulator [Chryseobacterium populi]|uniref:histidine kinase n=1 Tax=Chryseobacterium populi TaxID=1144316 RepID=J2KMM9_9FLAO|nr:ATP-binding protein [Chryseobacterium populi]EJL74353.1 signal transduction histidine kinase [Chryseobacterium populi]